MTAPYDLITHRDAIKDAVPPWLNRGVGEKIMYSLGIHVDALGDGMVEGVKARFPGHNPTATSEICKSRLIYRGPNETDEQIEARLIGWLDAHRLRGHPRGILEQLAAYLTPHPVRMRIVYNNGNYWERATNGVYTISTQAWNWDGNTTLFSRFWVILWPPTDGSLWVSDGIMSDPGLIGDGGVIGSNASPSDVAGVRQIVNFWGTPHARHMHTIVVFDDALWLAQQPDGTWGRMGNRNPNVNYWAGERS